MGALLNNVAVAHDQNFIRIADGRQPVRNNKTRTAFHQAVHGGLDALLGAGIDAGCCFVQNQNAIVGQNRTGDGQQLLLALADVGRVLVQLHLVAAGQRADKVVSVRGLGGGNDLLVGGIQAAIADVLHDRALEQPGILQYHAEAFSRGAAVKIAHIAAIQRNGTGVHIVKAHQQLDHRGFACAGGADDGHFLAGLDLAAEIVDNGLFRCVAKSHVVERDLAVDGGGVGTAGGVGLLVFLRLVQKFKHALRRSGHALQHIGHLRQLLDGLCEVFDVLNKRLDIADGDGPGCGKNAACDGHRHIAQIAHKVHDGLHQAGKKLAFPRRFVQLIVGDVEIRQHGFLTVERLDDVVAGVNFFDLAVDDAQRCLLCLKIFLAEFYHQQHQRQRDRQDQQRDQRHFAADGQHHDQNADHRGNAGD